MTELSLSTTEVVFLCSLVLLILLFGFAPGILLRLLVMVYPREEPRRRELVAEICQIRRIERPLYVFEQLETVLSEGLPLRLKAGWLQSQRLVRRMAARASRSGVLLWATSVTVLVSMTGAVGENVQPFLYPMVWLVVGGLGLYYLFGDNRSLVSRDPAALRPLWINVVPGKAEESRSYWMYLGFSPTQPGAALAAAV